MALRVLASPTFLDNLKSVPALPKDCWYFVAGVTFSILNRPDEAARVLQYAVIDQMSVKKGSAANEPLRIARKMREAMVKSAAIGGLPKTINSLLALKNVSTPEMRDDSSSTSPTGRSAELQDPRALILDRGQRFFDQVYGKVATRVMSQMDNCGTEDLGVLARLMYGYLLSNTRVLTEAESSYCLIAGLIPQDVNPQLKGHLKGALNNGASTAEVMAVRELVLRICEESGMRQINAGEPTLSGWRSNVAKL